MISPLSRRFWLAFALAISIFLGICAIWVQFPRLQQPQLVSDRLRNALERNTQLQLKAQDPELNGFLSVPLRPLWDQPDTVGEADTSAAERIRRWNLYSTQKSGETMDHERFSKSDVQYLAALSEFESLAPDLLEAFGKPVFTTPVIEPTFYSPLMNFSAVRSGVVGLITLAEYKSAQGQVWEAAQDLLEVLKFGRTVQDSSSLISDLAGVAFQSLALDSMFVLLTPGQSFEAQQWREVSQSLIKSLPDPEQLARILESEMLAAQNSIQQRDSNSRQSLQPSWAYNAPGLAQRELRIYFNIVSEMLGQLQTEGKIVMPLRLGEFSRSDYLAGKTGLLAVFALADLDLVQQQIIYNRNRVLGMAVTASVSAYLCEHGTLPKSLLSLAESGLPLPNESLIAQSRLTYRLDDQHATIEIPFVELLGREVALRPPGLVWPWFEATQGRLSFRVSESSPAEEEDHS